MGIISATVWMSSDAVGSLGERQWIVRLDHTLGPPKLLFTEGHRLSGDNSDIEAKQWCPQSTQYGVVGDAYIARLTGNHAGSQSDAAEVHHSKVTWDTAGKYKVEYTTPPVASDGYALTVSKAARGGLLGEYYNNRWLLGPPFESRVDPKVDFEWPTYITDRKSVV